MKTSATEKTFRMNGQYSVRDLMVLVRECAGDYFGRECTIESVSSTKAFLMGAIGCEESEQFGAIFLDNRHRVITFEILFSGTIDGASVYPREVVKRALQLNAAAVIFSHNHPSGDTTPSDADKRITDRLKEALGLVDVRVLDHFVVGQDCTSFAERGLL